MGGSEPGAALHEEGMGSSYQAFCIAQRGLQPWPFGAVVEEAGEEEEAGGAGEQQRQQGRGGRQPGQEGQPHGEQQ